MVETSASFGLVPWAEEVEAAASTGAVRIHIPTRHSSARAVRCLLGFHIDVTAVNVDCHDEVRRPSNDRRLGFPTRNDTSKETQGNRRCALKAIHD
jgi:hypothetical protein